jgi:hypothetical protein
VPARRNIVARRSCASARLTPVAGEGALSRLVGMCVVRSPVPAEGGHSGRKACDGPPTLLAASPGRAADGDRCVAAANAGKPDGSSSARPDPARSLPYSARNAPSYQVVCIRGLWRKRGLTPWHWTTARMRVGPGIAYRRGMRPSND